LEDISAAMQQPFPALTRLQFDAEDETPAHVPDLILGGSAPHLQELFLSYISFPGLPKLLLSTTHLVRLDLQCIPDFGYISPLAMATTLSALTRLEKLRIDFNSPQYYPHRGNPILPTRALLPFLTKFQFGGVSRYLEDLVSWIEVPLLSYLRMAFYRQDTFDTPQLSQFISCSPNFKAQNKAHLVISSWKNSVTFPQTFDGALRLRILYGQSAMFSSLARAFRSSFFPQAFIPAVEHLYIYGDLEREEDIDNSRWLELLRPFAAVKGLHMTRRFAPRFVPALQELAGERLTDVLPALQTIFLEEPLPSGPILDDTGRLAGYALSVSRWAIEEYEFTYESDDDIDRV
jgi:hypothetical protein